LTLVEKTHDILNNIQKKQVSEVLIALKKELLAKERPEDVAITLQKKRRLLFPLEDEAGEDS